MSVVNFNSNRIIINTGRKIINVPAYIDDSGTASVRVSTTETGAPILTIWIDCKTVRLAGNGSQNAMRSIARKAAKELGLKGTPRYVKNHTVQLVSTDRKTGDETLVATIAVGI